MILLERLLANVPADFRKAKQPEKALALVRFAAAAKPAFGKRESAHWKRAKAALRRESFDKCVYCESPTATVAHGDVEHFRPKSLYWWLAFCYDNYVFACQICNQSFKGNQFPIAAKAMAAPKKPASSAKTARLAFAASLAPAADDEPARKHFWKRCDAEKAWLLDPYREDPERWIAWSSDAVLRETRAVPIPRSPKSKRIVQVAEEILGLNREELLRERFLRWSMIDTLLAVATENGLSKSVRQRTLDEIARLQAADQPYAAMMRFFVRQATNTSKQLRNLLAPGT
ncbi:MAG: hypothetical protein JNM84_05790 [Planctomycetes bacterium]|nr:hypothetical protein [Planctomycetota bacterium]